MSVATTRLPDGWDRIDDDGPYTKFVKRGAVTVPKRAREGSQFDRDAVVIVTDELAGVVKGPGARQSWQTDSPEVLGRRLAEVVEEWVASGGDPYGGSDLNDDLAAAANEVTA